MSPLNLKTIYLFHVGNLLISRGKKTEQITCCRIFYHRIRWYFVVKWRYWTNKEAWLMHTFRNDCFRIFFSISSAKWTLGDNNSCETVLWKWLVVDSHENITTFTIIVIVWCSNSRLFYTLEHIFWKWFKSPKKFNNKNFLQCFCKNMAYFIHQFACIFFKWLSVTLEFLFVRSSSRFRFWSVLKTDK